MVRRGKDVTKAELAVLQVLWKGGEPSIRSLADVLYPGGAASDYATVQKLLARLEKKGFVTRRREGGRNLYAAALDRDDLIARRLQETAESLCEGSLTPLLTNLVRANRLSSEERLRLRQLMDELEERED
ncbi:MAG: BlaI/MecI/CopY family transcriptional regulator [Planctomycetota bacterium]